MSEEENAKLSPEEWAELNGILEAHCSTEEITRFIHKISDTERSGEAPGSTDAFHFVLWAMLNLQHHGKESAERSEGKKSGAGCVAAGKHISPTAQASMREVIAEYGGVEVFFVGYVGGNSIIEEVEPLAFGNRDAAPVVERLLVPGTVSIHNHPSGSLEPSQEDVALANRWSKWEVGSYITGNKVETIRVVVPAFDVNHIKGRVRL